MLYKKEYETKIVGSRLYILEKYDCPEWKGLLFRVLIAL